jgi:hypothetical protein
MVELICGCQVDEVGKDISAIKTVINTVVKISFYSLMVM